MRVRPLLLGLAALAAVGLSTAGPAVAQSNPHGVRLVRILAGLTDPLGIVSADDGTGRLFVLEQGGRVWVYRRSTGLSPAPFLDLTGQVSTQREGGMLGLAFHPDFPADPRVFVSYTDTAGDSVLASYELDGADPDRLDPASARQVLFVDQPRSNHNGGHVTFGPDGYLYWGLGDGGGAGDPDDLAQDLGSPLGSLLRLDVDGDDFPSDPNRNYAVPADNPFVGQAGAVEEIWVYGLRNPWRFSFDRATGDLFIGDVGQSSREEVSYLAAGAGGGANFGWRCYEGSQVYNAAECAAPSAYVFPILEYGHDLGCSVTGGFRHRGPETELAGIYLFADYCFGRLWGGTQGAGGWTAELWLDTDLTLSSFGEGPAGEIYAVSLSGEIYRLTIPLFADGFESSDLSAWPRSSSF